MKKILVLPGWMTDLQLCRLQKDWQLQFGRVVGPLTGDDVVVGMSLGALIVIRESARIPGRIILVNPPLPRRSVFVWLIRLIQMIAHETPFNNRQRFTRNPWRFATEIVRCVRLLSTDFDRVITSLPKERLIVIRGVHDRFFADHATVDYFRSKNITVIEVESGHNWGEMLEQEIEKQSSALS